MAQRIRTAPLAVLVALEKLTLQRRRGKTAVGKGSRVESGRLPAPCAVPASHGQLRTRSDPRSEAPIGGVARRRRECARIGAQWVNAMRGRFGKGLEPSRVPVCVYSRCDSVANGRPAWESAD